MERHASKLADVMVSTMRQEQTEGIKQHSVKAEMGRIMKYNAGTGDIWIDPDSFDEVITKKSVLIPVGYTPVAGHRVLLVPVSTGEWAIVARY